MSPTTLDLYEHGARHVPGAVLNHLDVLRAFADTLPVDKAGVRLAEVTPLRPILSPSGAIGALAAEALGTDARLVRAILFDKTAATNWSLGWHQDRTICVKERVPVADFGPWTIKAGVHHVAPPFAILRRMATLRIHLDSVPTGNAPLLIAPGSHAIGMIPVGEVAEVVQRCGIVQCLAAAGDVWVYSTPILHASEAAGIPQRRRVLQVDYVSGDLPGGLEWAYR